MIASKVKRKRHPAAEGSGQLTAWQAYQEVCRTCSRCAQLPPGMLQAPVGDLFWALPYEPHCVEPQLVVIIERYVLPNRKLKHTVFNDAGFLARVVYQQAPLEQAVAGEASRRGLVLVKPMRHEGCLRLTWPAVLIGPTLDELFERSSPCVMPAAAVEACDEQEQEVCSVGMLARSGCVRLCGPESGLVTLNALVQELRKRMCRVSVVADTGMEPETVASAEDGCSVMVDA